MEKLIIELNSDDDDGEDDDGDDIYGLPCCDHFVHCLFVKPLALILDINSQKQ